MVTKESMYSIAWYDGLKAQVWRWVCTLCTASALTNPLGAQFKWHITETAVQADPAKSTVAVTFPFVNEGKGASSIVAVLPSCGCTVTTLEKTTYQPGESGSLTALVGYGPDVSRAEQSITVTTQPYSSQVLKISITIPGQRRPVDRVEVSPQSLQWALRSAAESNLVALRVRPNDAIRPIKALSSSPKFSAELLDPDPRDPHVFRLRVTPLGTDQPAEGVVRIVTNSDTFNPEWRKEPPLEYSVSVAVR